MRCRNRLGRANSDAGQLAGTVLVLERGGNKHTVPAERLSMRKIKEVLRLKFEVGLPNRQIARSCGINHSTVADYLYRAKAASLECWPLPDLDDTQLEARLFPARPPATSPQVRPAP